MDGGNPTVNSAKDETAAADGLQGSVSDVTDLDPRRRRYVVSCLRSHVNPMALADVADEVAIRENGVPITDIPAEAVKRVYFSLYHTHVPALEDAGIVDYTQEGDLVELCSTPVAESAPEGVA